MRLRQSHLHRVVPVTSPVTTHDRVGNLLYFSQIEIGNAVDVLVLLGRLRSQREHGQVAGNL